MRAASLVLGLIVISVAWGPRVARAQEIDGEGLLPIPASNHHVLEEQLGIQILSLRLTSANSLLALRFRVVNTDRAALLFDQDRPHVIHQISRTKLHSVTPLPLHPMAEGIYTLLFTTEGTVRHGDNMTVLVGDFRVEGIVVFASVDPAAF